MSSGSDPEIFPQPIPYGRQAIDENDIAAVVAALRSDFVTQGPRVQAFEDALCEFTGARYAVAVASGTAALHLACAGLGIEGRGVVPAVTFVATANCLRYQGVEVGFCDVDPTTGVANEGHFREALEAEPAQALLPVSLAGSVPNLEAIAKLAQSTGAYVIEDAAHSLGARYRSEDGRSCGSASCLHSHAAILSFHPVKHICSGEGGALLTNDEVLARRARRLRSHGIEKLKDWQYDQVELGFHYRMTDIQAALGLSQLGKLPGFLAKRASLVQRYQEAFAKAPYAGRIRIANLDGDSAYHLLVIHFANEGERKRAYDYFHQRNVRVQVHYRPVYQNSYYRESGGFSLQGAESYYATCLSLPLHPSLTDEEQAFVIRCLADFLESEDN